MVIIAFLIKINRKLLITTLSHYNFHRCWVQTLLKRNPASARCTLGKVIRRNVNGSHGCRYPDLGLAKMVLLHHWFSALTLLVVWQEGHPACKNWAVGCWCGYLSGARCRLAYGPADSTATHCLLLHKIQIGFTFLVPAHLGSPGKRAVKRACVCDSTATHCLLLQ